MAQVTVTFECTPYQASLLIALHEILTRDRFQDITMAIQDMSPQTVENTIVLADELRDIAGAAAWTLLNVFGAYNSLDEMTSDAFLALVELDLPTTRDTPQSSP